MPSSSLDEIEVVVGVGVGVGVEVEDCGRMLSA